MHTDWNTHGQKQLSSVNHIHLKSNSKRRHNWGAYDSAVTLLAIKLCA